MQAYSIHPAEINCTCGYLSTASNSNASLAHPNLTYQVGCLLIALGSMFINAPMLNIHINRSTADILISIGAKLTRSAKQPKRMVS
ncbi:MAG: hypothetical protein QY306_11545 [Anaerolineales bacterium]|nr:MAG: hypothetical protein QY306_11545 [Anaerolineales bacterium]